MKYTKKERKNIYKEVLSKIQGEHVFGICFNLSTISGCQEYGEFSLRELFPEIWEQKPEKAPLGGYWFSNDKQGDKERIKILENAIKKLS